MKDSDPTAAVEDYATRYRLAGDAKGELTAMLAEARSQALKDALAWVLWEKASTVPFPDNGTLPFPELDPVAKCLPVDSNTLADGARFAKAFGLYDELSDRLPDVPPPPDPKDFESCGTGWDACAKGHCDTVIRNAEAMLPDRYDDYSRREARRCVGRVYSMLIAACYGIDEAKKKAKTDERQ